MYDYQDDDTTSQHKASIWKKITHYAEMFIDKFLISKFAIFNFCIVTTIYAGSAITIYSPLLEKIFGLAMIVQAIRLAFHGIKEGK